VNLVLTLIKKWIDVDVFEFDLLWMLPIIRIITH